MTAKKKPSIQKQLTDCRNELALAQAALATKQKEADNLKSTQTYYERNATEARSELAQIHSFLDAVPNPPASKAVDGHTPIAAMTRLSVWLATRGAQA